jgi:mannose-6-phosphate isomerase
MYYPLRFHVVYKDYIWGGRSLADLGKILPEGQRVAESWEISAHPNGVSVIANGPLAGISLTDACSKLGRSLLGSRLPDKDLRRFPLLIKLIDAHDRLSVQVHPDDAYAGRHERGETGKNEMWYVVSAGPDARLIAGVKPGVDRAAFAAALADGACLELLQEIPVKAGDALNIPSGLVHAIGSDLVICEIQQNADTTYRVFDYNRRDDAGLTRPLHIEKALDVIDFSRQNPSPLIQGLIIQEDHLVRRILVLNRYFMVEELCVDGKAAFAGDGSRFSTLTVIGGKGSIAWRNEAGHMISDPLFAGDSILLPASLATWEIGGNLKMICSRPSLFLSDAAWLADRLDLPACGTDGGTGFLAALEAAAGRGLIALDPKPAAH